MQCPFLLLHPPVPSGLATPAFFLLLEFSNPSPSCLSSCCRPSGALCISLLPDCHLGSGISPPREAWRTGLCGSCFLCECCHPFSLSLCPVDTTTASALGSGGTRVLYLGAQAAGVPSWCLICHTGTFWGSAVSLTLAKCEEEWGGSVRMTVTCL